MNLDKFSKTSEQSLKLNTESTMKNVKKQTSRQNNDSNITSFQTNKA